MPIRVSVDGVADVVHTHRRTVGALLLDLGVTLNEHDRVTPPPLTRLHAQMKITVARARPVQLWADGAERTVASWGMTPSAILQDAGIDVNRYDRVLLDGASLALDGMLPPDTRPLIAATYSRGYAWDNLRLTPLRLRLQRAIPITVEDGGLPFTIRTTAQTVGEALRQAEITIYLGDIVQPTMGAQVTPGLRIFIQRSKPITLRLDGRVVKTRTRAQIVSDALVEVGIGISGLDRVEPELSARLRDDLEITITRVREEVDVLEKIAPFETVFEPDATLPIDTQQVMKPGAEGITRQRYRVRYEDGQEVSRQLEDTWIAQEPAQRVIAYGQLIEPKTFVTADGTSITYWRKIRMLASSYSAATSGVSKDQPWYGRTYSGEKMRKGVTAVDPKIIPMRSGLYIPGYGYGEALDTGTAIRSRRIDLGYDDDNLELWNRWVDVYLLWPPPPAYQITWVVPNYPRVPN